MNSRTRLDEQPGLHGDLATAVRCGRRKLLLGGGVAALSAACSAADDYGSEEPSEELTQAYTWVNSTNVSFSSVPSWPYSTIVTFFEYARDVMLLRQGGAGSMRRVAWLYPDAGCEARAEIIVHRAQYSLLTKPYKVFAMNNLKLYTNNHPKGYVTWGLHVAPVVRSSATGIPYVLDPSVYPQAPLTWSSWFARLNPVSHTVVAVTNSTYYSPLALNGGNITTATNDMEQKYLKLEYDRQVELGRNPAQVLGDNPPW